jgi:hypothetical protein
MSERCNQVITYLDDAEYQQLQEWSDTTGKSMSHLLREAILEYTDRDRTARIEEKVDRVLAQFGETEHTHTWNMDPPKPQKSVPDKAREIARRLYSNHEMPVKGTDVELAIEDIAGGDTRTVAKYKDQLKKRGLLYEHPVQPVWSDEKTQWVKWVENATVSGSVLDWTTEYGIETDEYEKIASEVSQ